MLTDSGLMSTAQPEGQYRQHRRVNHHSANRCRVNVNSTAGGTIPTAQEWVNHHSANRCRVNVNSTAGGTIPTAQDGLITKALTDVVLMSTAQPEGQYRQHRRG